MARPRAPHRRRRLLDSVSGRGPAGFDVVARGGFIDRHHAHLAAALEGQRRTCARPAWGRASALGGVAAAPRWAARWSAERSGARPPEAPAWRRLRGRGFQPVAFG